ncbi:MAG TPA: glycosyl hydrolase, partial [Algoriphagus sp.]|nr:glycosyl hydrolase [Algoriphagus sp.]
AGVIWTGSDDGLVHLTRDGAKTWINVTPKGLQETLINAIEVSPHDPATAYIATTRYKFNDYTPAIYKTTDYGKTWTNISKGIPYGAFTRVVREDSKKKGLLYAGTEQGVYISRDGGANWTSFQLNLPVTPITDLKVAHDDLIVATSGRSFWILDELNVAREVKEKVDQPTLYTPENALLGNWYSSMNGGNLEEFTGTHPFEGINPANGMVIHYSLPESVTDSTELTLEILDAKGNMVRKISSKRIPDAKSWAGGPPLEPTISTRKGLNRFVWDMRHPTMPGIPGVYIESSYRGHKAIPGMYTIRLSGMGVSSEAQAEIKDIPAYKLTAADYQAYHEWMSKLEAEVSTMHNMVNTAKDYQDQLASLLKRLEGKAEYQEIKSAGEVLLKELKAWDEEMIQRRSTAYDDVENFPNKFTANFLFMLNHGESSIPKVNEGTKAEYSRLMEQWKPLKAEGERLIDSAVQDFNQKAKEAGVWVLFVK